MRNSRTHATARSVSCRAPDSNGYDCAVTSTATWIEEHSLRRSAHQVERIETTKTVATFASGIAAALVASAMQSYGGTPVAISSVAALGVSIALVLVIFVVGQLSEPDGKQIEALCVAAGLPPDRVLVLLRLGFEHALDANQEVVRFVTVVAVLQVAAASSSAAFAIWAMWQVR